MTERKGDVNIKIIEYCFSIILLAVIGSAIIGINYFLIEVLLISDLPIIVNIVFKLICVIIFIMEYNCLIYVIKNRKNILNNWRE